MAKAACEESIARPRTPCSRDVATTKSWILEFEPAGPKRHDPLMGWVSSGDTVSQVRMRFATSDEALAYAEKHGLDAVAETPRERRIRPKSYADNFRWQPSS